MDGTSTVRKVRSRQLTFDDLIEFRGKIAPDRGVCVEGAGGADQSEL